MGEFKGLYPLSINYGLLVNSGGRDIIVFSCVPTEEPPGSSYSSRATVLHDPVEKSLLHGKIEIPRKIQTKETIDSKAPLRGSDLRSNLSLRQSFEIRLQELYPVGRERRSRDAYLGIVTGEHGSFCLAKTVSLLLVTGTGGKAVIGNCKMVAVPRGKIGTFHPTSERVLPMPGFNTMAITMLVKYLFCMTVCSTLMKLASLLTWRVVRPSAARIPLSVQVAVNPSLLLNSWQYRGERGKEDGSETLDVKSLRHNPLEGMVYIHNLLESTIYTHSPLEDKAYTHSPLEGTVYTHSPLEGTVYTHSPLEDRVYTHSPLEGTVYTHRPLEGTVYTHSPLEDRVYTHSPLEGTVYTHSPLKGTVYTHSQLEGTVYTHSPLEGTVYTHSPLEDRIYTHSPLEGTVYTHNPLEGTVYTHSPLEGTVYTHKSSSSVCISTYCFSLKMLL
ncbi:hypothetical protein STEG23_022010 [Scotinomys teguina]